MFPLIHRGLQNSDVLSLCLYPSAGIAHTEALLSALVAPRHSGGWTDGLSGPESVSFRLPGSPDDRLIPYQSIGFPLKSLRTCSLKHN